MATNSLLLILLSHSIVVNECDVNPCQNGGSCSLIGQNYVCDCVNGFQGSFCQSRPPSSLVGKSKLQLSMLRTRTFFNNNVVMLPEVQYSEYAGSQCL